MDVINNKTVVVYDSLEFKNVLENDNGYEYIYIGDDIVLEQNININENKEKIIINGTYNNIRYKLTGMNSNVASDTINVSSSNKEIQIKNIDIEYTNTYGVFYVQENKSFSNILIVCDNIVFNGTKLIFNPYGIVKIIDSTINMVETNSIIPQEVCKSFHVIIGGKTNISAINASAPIFNFRSDVIQPSIVFLCKSDVVITSDNNSFMNGTSRLNFSILHDANVMIITCNGFAGYTIHGANNVLIDERAVFSFMENNHRRIPMWSVFGNFTLKKDSCLEVINSYASTPSDNYNIHFKGSNQKILFDNPKYVKFYTKNSNILYTNNQVEFTIKCSRFNLWNNSKTLSEAGSINDLPDYSWYKKDDLLVLNGSFDNSSTIITSHNLTDLELINLSDISNFSFQGKKCFSIGSCIINVHSISNVSRIIGGHTVPNSEVLIRYDNFSGIVSADSDGLFEYNYTNDIVDDTKIEIISNDPNGFIYGTRVVSFPYDGELSIMSSNCFFEFSLVPVSDNMSLFKKNSSLVIKVVDSRVDKSSWSIVASLDGNFSSIGGYSLNDALVFKKFNDDIVVLTDMPQVVYTNDDGSDVVTVEWSSEKGPLLDLSNNYLVVDEEYFACINFKLEE